MLTRTNSLLVAVVCGVALVASAQDGQFDDTSRLERASISQAKQSKGNLNADDRLALISAALDRKTRRHSERDCSHLVHAIYEEAGLPYSYAPSSELYRGMEPFRMVKRPQAGDLVVWRGHVGMVIKPSRHTFYSFLRSGPGIDDYQAPYWRALGRARFYRYAKRDR